MADSPDNPEQSKASEKETSAENEASSTKDTGSEGEAVKKQSASEKADSKSTSKEEILSQDEMDTLLKGVSDGNVKIEKSASKTSTERIFAYDFSHPTHKLKTHLPLLEVVNDRFARYFAVELSAQLHQPVDVTIEDFSTYKFQEYAHSLSEGVSINRIKIDPLPGTSLMCFDSNLVFTLVDSFFGGSGQGKNMPPGTGRAFTPTEKRIVERCINRAFKALVSAWSTIHKIEPAFLRQEVNAQITSPANPSEVTITSKFKISLAFGSGEFHLAIPYPSLDPMRPFLTATVDKPRENDSAWASDFSNRVFESLIEIQGIIAETEITLSELVTLKVGDFIPLGQTRNALFSAEGIPLFEAAFGASNGMISAQIIDRQNEQQP